MMYVGVHKILMLCQTQIYDTYIFIFDTTFQLTMHLTRARLKKKIIQAKEKIST